MHAAMSDGLGNGLAPLQEMSVAANIGLRLPETAISGTRFVSGSVKTRSSAGESGFTYGL